MYVNIFGERYEFDKDNTMYFTGETLIHGLYADINEDDYLYVPTDLMEHPEEILDAIVDERIPVIDLVYYDPEEPPFCFIINAMCRLFSHEIDEVCDGEN
jgi:hypothetical protein